MAYYYEKLNIEEVERLTDSAGKTAHLIKNYCQGYNNLAYPEITY